MSELQMGIVESKFADIIWRTAPVTSSQLVKLGEAEMGWKRTTVHTVLRCILLIGRLAVPAGGEQGRRQQDETSAPDHPAARLRRTYCRMPPLR